jgi:hypothetical protein
MDHFTDLQNEKEVLDSIAVLEKELSEKTGKKVAVVAYSPAKYASLDGDENALRKISELEKEISGKTGKDVILVAFSL